MNKKRKDVGRKHVNNSNAFTECSNTMDGVYENINDYNPNRNPKKNVIVFKDMIAELMTNKKFQVIIKWFLLGVEK